MNRSCMAMKQGSSLNACCSPVMEEPSECIPKAKPSTTCRAASWRSASTSCADFSLIIFSRFEVYSLSLLRMEIRSRARLRDTCSSSSSMGLVMKSEASSLRP